MSEIERRTKSSGGSAHADAKLREMRKAEGRKVCVRDVHSMWIEDKPTSPKFINKRKPA